MTPSTESSVKQFIEALTLPGLDHPIGDLGRVTAADAKDASVSVSVELGFPAEGVNARWREFIADAVKADAGLDEVDVKLTSSIAANVPSSTVKRVVRPRTSSRRGTGLSAPRACADRCHSERQ